jgi:hypothetical protein
MGARSKSIHHGSYQQTSLDPRMHDWQGIKEMRIMREYFEARYAQTCQIIAESPNEG